MIATTPKKISAPVRQFCKEICPKCRPIYVPVEPELHAVRDQCFENVKLMVQKHGGSQIYGWMICIWPNVFAEAIHHGIWQGQDGRLVDVTPKAGGERRILFLPDPQREYDHLTHRRIDSIRTAFVKDINVNRFLYVRHEIFKLIEEGSKDSGLHATVDAHDLLVLQTRHDQLLGKIVSKYLRPNDRCPCGNGKKYKFCHGRS